jgi:hypothetical protein
MNGQMGLSDSVKSLQVSAIESLVVTPVKYLQTSIRRWTGTWNTSITSSIRLRSTPVMT